MNAGMHRAFGLAIRSCLSLPAPRIADTVVSDVDIVYGSLPTELADVRERGVRFQVAPQTLLLTVDGVAKYMAAGGRQITIDRAPEAADDQVLVFLAGTSLAALLHQRHDLVLHASAVEVDDAAVAFVGPSGAGKSTVAAALRHRGYRVLCDDICVVRSEGGILCAQPGLSRMLLWPDSLRALDIPKDSLTRVRSTLEKRVVPLQSPPPVSRPLRAIYFLQPSNRDSIAITELAGTPKLDAIRRETYRGRMVIGMGLAKPIFKHSLSLAAQVRASTVSRPRVPFAVNPLIDELEAHFRQ